MVPSGVFEKSLKLLLQKHWVRKVEIEMKFPDIVQNQVYQKYAPPPYSSGGREGPQ
jgi:hypothetical protein